MSNLWRYSEDVRTQEQRVKDYEAWRAVRREAESTRVLPRERDTPRPDPRRATTGFDYDALFYEYWR